MTSGSKWFFFDSLVLFLLLTELILMKDSCFSLSGVKPSTASNSEGSALRKCGNDRYNGASERTAKSY